MTDQQKTEMSILERHYFQTYGATLNTKQLAEVFGYKNTNSLLVAISNENFPIKTRKQGKRRVADYTTVAHYFERQQKSA